MVPPILDEIDTTETNLIRYNISFCTKVVLLSGKQKNHVTVRNDKHFIWIFYMYYHELGTD